MPDYMPPEHDTARLIQVVETTIERRGDGKSDAAPLRVVTQYWTLDGRLLAERDPAETLTGSRPWNERQ